MENTTTGSFRNRRCWLCGQFYPDGCFHYCGTAIMPFPWAVNGTAVDMIAYRIVFEKGTTALKENQ